MTRSSKLALVTLLAGLLSLASVGTVSADPPCTRSAQGNCAQMAAADDAILFHAAVSPASDAPYSGVVREHKEATQAGQSWAQVAMSVPDYAFAPQFGQAEDDQIRTALEMANGAATLNAAPVDSAQG